MEPGKFKEGALAVRDATANGRLALLLGACRVKYEGRAASKLS